MPPAMPHGIPQMRPRVYGQFLSDEKQKHDAYVLLLVLLFSDVALIVLHAFNGSANGINGQPVRELFRIDAQFGLGSLLMFGKLGLVILLLSEIKYLRRDRAFDFWKYLFLYVLLDDIFEISAQAGGWMSTLFSFEEFMGLTPADYGKFAFAIGGGLIVSGFLGYLLRHSSRAFVSASFAIFVLLSAFAFFAVFFDIVHAFFDQDPKLEFPLGMLEEGGEMIVVSFLVAYIFYLYGMSRTAARQPSPRAAPWRAEREPSRLWRA
jgi:hypothetical protein